MPACQRSSFWGVPQALPLPYLTSTIFRLPVARSSIIPTGARLCSPGSNGSETVPLCFRHLACLVHACKYRGLKLVLRGGLEGPFRT